MSDNFTPLLEGLRLRERELELEAVAIRAKVEEIRSLIERLEQAEPRRPGRPRKVFTVMTDHIMNPLTDGEAA